MTGGYTMKEKNIQELAIRMGLITVEDMCQYTIAQLVVKIANKVNELVDEVWRFESDVQEILKTQNENIQYLLGEGLHLEVGNIFDGWVQDGTFDALLNHSALKSVNDRIDETNAQLSQKVNHVTVEEFGVIGDGITDDTEKLQQAINFACENSLTLTCKTGKTFYTSSPLVISKGFYLDFANSTIKSSGDTSIIVNIPAGEAIDTQSFIKRLTIDCEKNSKGLSITAKRCYLENLYFKNIHNVGLSIDGGYEVTVSNCNFRGVSPTNKAIVVNTTDIYIEHCFGTDNNVFIENNASGNIFESCHAWIYTPSVLPNSIFIDLAVSGLVTNCVSDTYYIGFKCRTIGTSRIANSNFIINPEYYNKSNYSEPPIFIYFDGERAYRTSIINNWVSFPDTSLTGYDVPGKLYNIDKINVQGQVYGNTGYNVDMFNTCKVMLSNAPGNISTKQSYVIRKNGRVTLKCCFAFDGSIPSSETVIFTLPDGMRPFQNFYGFGHMGTNIDNISKTCHVFIESNGDVKVKNASGDNSMSQGLVVLEFDTWEPGI